jgi:hypothetical protein
MYNETPLGQFFSPNLNLNGNKNQNKNNNNNKINHPFFNNCIEKDKLKENGNGNFIEPESIIFRNIDIKFDIYNTLPEKNIKRLPLNLRFIKKYIYLEFLPKIDKLIEDLEKIKTTPNYDEKTIQIKPNQVIKTMPISCSNLFDNHNLTTMKSNKIIYGTYTGNIIIYDLDINKLLNEKFLGIKSRVEIIETSTIKFFDSLLSRIAIHFRGDQNINIISYNHSYNTINHECVISLKDNYANITQEPNSIPLNTIPCNINLSKDTFMMTVVDYNGGVRIFKFNEIPQSPAIIQDTRAQIKDNPMNMGFMMGKNIERKFQDGNSGQLNTSNFNNINTNNLITGNSSSSSNLQITATLIGYYKLKETQNYSILALGKNIKLDDKNKKDKNKKDKDKEKEEEEKIKNQNQNQNLKKNEKKDIIQENHLGDDGCYNVKPYFNEENFDLTPCLKFPKNKPEIIFLQKKFVIEEKNNGNFSNSIVTIGFYIAFIGTNQFKYISLYSYLTNNMKVVFKIQKNKNNLFTNEDTTTSVNSSINRREKEYMKFIKSKLDPLLNSINNNNNSNNLNLSNNNQNPNSNINTIPNINQNQNPNPNTNTNIQSQIKEKGSNIQNPIYADNTKNEFCYETLVNITNICGQRQINSRNTYIALGMEDGTVLIWDTELQCDKFLFQDNKNEILSMTLDNNYLLTTSRDGKVYIYELIKGQNLFNCYHNPYKNFPVFYVRNKLTYYI